MQSNVFDQLESCAHLTWTINVVQPIHMFAGISSAIRLLDKDNAIENHCRSNRDRVKCTHHISMRAISYRPTRYPWLLSMPKRIFKTHSTERNFYCVVFLVFWERNTWGSMPFFGNALTECKCVSTYVFVCYLSRFAFREIQKYTVEGIYWERYVERTREYREICRGTYRLYTIERHGEAHRVVLNTQHYTYKLAYRHTERNIERFI